MLIFIMALFLCAGLYLKPVRFTAYICVLSPLFSEMAIGNIGLNTLFAIIAIISYILHYRMNMRFKNNPFKWAIVMMGVSVIVSNYCSSEPHIIPLIGAFSGLCMMLIISVYANRGGIFHIAFKHSRCCL